MEWNEMSQRLFNDAESTYKIWPHHLAETKVFDNNSSLSRILLRGPFDNSTSMLWAQIKSENSKIDLRW